LRLRWRCELGGRVSVPRFRAGAEPLRRGGQREGARRARHRRPFRGAQQRQMTSRSAQTDPARVPVLPAGRGARRLREPVPRARTCEPRDACHPWPQRPLLRR
jgi:hypothetical protein